jgi:hypothetical protein
MFLKIKAKKAKVKKAAPASARKAPLKASAVNAILKNVDWNDYRERVNSAVAKQDAEYSRAFARGGSVSL